MCVVRHRDTSPRDGEAHPHDWKTPLRCVSTLSPAHHCPWKRNPTALTTEWMLEERVPSIKKPKKLPLLRIPLWLCITSVQNTSTDCWLPVVSDILRVWHLAGSVSIKHMSYWYQVLVSILPWVSCSAKPCKYLLHLHHYFYQLSLSSHQRIFDKTCFQDTTAVMHLGASENMPGIHLNLCAPHIYKICVSVSYYSGDSDLWGVFLLLFMKSLKNLLYEKQNETMF